MTVFANALRSLLILASLAFSLTGCQTLGNAPEAEPDKPSLADTQKALVRNALDAGKPEQALKILKDLLRATPEEPGLNNLMGLTQLALKNPQRAIKHLMKAYKAEKSIAVALNLSSAYLEAGEADKSVALLTAMAKQADKEKYAYKERIFHNLGYAHARLNQMTQATAWFKEAIEENPSFFPSHLELARVYEKTNRPAMAAKAYVRAIDYCQTCFEPVYALSNIYLKMGKPMEARQLLVKYNRSADLNPTDRAAAQRLLKVVNNSTGPQRRNG
jgi:tetratricopeptide (TPR) repeat protein